MIEYALAMYDVNKENKWFILKKRFIIEDTEDNTINGIFLRDIWFNYDVGNGDFKNDIHFMLIKTDQRENFVLDDINRNTLNEEHKPSILDKPMYNSLESYYFVLEKQVINSFTKSVLGLNKNGFTKKLTIRNKETNSEVFLSFEFCNYDNKTVLMTLPKFKI